MRSEELRKFEEACKNEAGALSELINPNHKLTYSDLLTKSLDEVAVFLKVNKINKKLRQADFSKKFPIYSGQLKYRLKKASIVSLNAQLAQFSTDN